MDLFRMLLSFFSAKPEVIEQVVVAEIKATPVKVKKAVNAKMSKQPRNK